MKSLAVIAAAVAVLGVLTPPQSAQAQYYYGQSQYIQPGVPSAQLGGATIHPDGSFSNNGYSWNGADPAGGWRGNVTPVYQAPVNVYRTVYSSQSGYQSWYNAQKEAFRRSHAYLSPFQFNRLWEEQQTQLQIQHRWEQLQQSQYQDWHHGGHQWDSWHHN